MRGRKPNLKPIEGGLSHVPRAPSWLPAEAREEWRRVLPVLIKRRVLTVTDLSAVENYCLATGMVRRALKAIVAEGDTIDGRRNPAFATLTSMMSEARRLAAELGLTPASRAKAEHAPVGEAIDEDTYADLGI